MIIHIGHTVDMERYLHEQAFSQAVESGTCLIINANIESKIINFIMLDRPDLIAELYETNKLHSDARFINFDHFTGLQVASLFKAIESIKYFISLGASTTLTNVIGRDALWYVTTKNILMGMKKLGDNEIYDNEMEEKDDLQEFYFLSKQLDKLLITAHLARIPTDVKLEDAYQKMELTKILRIRFNELQNYQDINDLPPMPEKMYHDFMKMIVHDELNDFKEYLSTINNNEEDDDGDGSSNININNHIIHAPILNSNPFLKRTYLRHEIFKRIHLCPKIYAYFTALSYVEKSSYKNFVDSNGREADYFLSLEYLELSQELKCDDAEFLTFNDTEMVMKGNKNGQDNLKSLTTSSTMSLNTRSDTK